LDRLQETILLEHINSLKFFIKNLSLRLLFYFYSFYPCMIFTYEKYVLLRRVHLVAAPRIASG